MQGPSDISVQLGPPDRVTNFTGSSIHIQIQCWAKEIAIRVKKLNLNQTHDLMPALGK